MKKTFSTNTSWEQRVAYSRAVRVGDIIEVAGTTAVENGEVVYPEDAGKQTEVILNKIKIALEELGGSLENVVRTRMY
ncbi:MAG: Rid family hydrolase, partial [Bacteroidota bacterium]